VNTKALCFLLTLTVLFQAAQAQSFKLTVAENGEAAVWRSSSGEKEQIKGSGEVGIGDTLFALADADARISFESKSALLIKGGSVVVLNGKESSIDVSIEEGQVFLDRNQPHELTSLRILTKGFSFTPTGTAASIRTNGPDDPPAVAVLRGSVRMNSPRGGSVNVEALQVGTANRSGVLFSQPLTERDVQRLEAWSGVKAQTAADQNALEQAAPESNNEAAAAASEAPKAEDSQAADSGEKSEDVEQAATAGASKDKPAPLKKESAEKDKKSDGSTLSMPTFELSAGMMTVNDETWTRIALGMDVPIWRFGVFFDLELFIDPESKLSNKGWDFKDNWPDALARKIRYIRYGRENDPLFVKFGGLDNVTMGYGIIMDRFTNMLRYPDEKLLGLQVHLNDISDYGMYLQAVISDFAEAKDKGGIGAVRLAFTPLKTSGMPLLDRFTIGATYAQDRNVYSPARKWKKSAEDVLLDSLSKKDWWTDYKNLHDSIIGGNLDERISNSRKEDSLSKCTRSFHLYGFDAGLPIIRSSLLSVDLYGQSAIRADTIRGWGIGAPGLAVKVWKLNGNIEYRKIEGKFTPGYFDRYYLDERLPRRLFEDESGKGYKDKSEYIPDVSLNGVFGSASMDVFGLLQVNGSYQYMLGKEDNKDQRYEASAGVGEMITSRIPKIGLLEVYVKNSNIGMLGNFKYDKNGEIAKSDKAATTNILAGRFDRSPYMYWGYRAGFEIAPGASLVWDYRYGWTVKGDKLVPDNFMTIKTALTF